jgi:uncharacterized protein
MDTGRLIDADSGVTLLGTVYRANTAWERLRGLLGHAPLGDGEGLLIDPCASIHTLFMTYPIDIVYLRRDRSVVRVVPALPPWRCSLALGAALTLELRAGGATRAGLAPGRRIAWQEGKRFV